MVWDGFRRGTLPAIQRSNYTVAKIVQRRAELTKSVAPRVRAMNTIFQLSSLSGKWMRVESGKWWKQREWKHSICIKENKSSSPSTASSSSCWTRAHSRLCFSTPVISLTLSFIVSSLTLLLLGERAGAFAKESCSARTSGRSWFAVQSGVGTPPRNGLVSRTPCIAG